MSAWPSEPGSITRTIKRHGYGGFLSPASIRPGSSQFHHSRANGTELCRLSNKRYFTSLLKPGKVDFTSVAGGLNIPDKDVLSLDLEANKVYYIQGDAKVRFMSDKLVLTEVTESSAKKKLPDMKPDNCMTASGK